MIALLAQANNSAATALLGTGMIFLLLALLYAVLWIYCIFNAATRPDLDSGQRIVWIVVLLFLHGIGPILYLLLARRRTP